MTGLAEDETKERALGDALHRALWLRGRTIAKVVVVPKKLVNIVLQ